MYYRDSVSHLKSEQHEHQQNHLLVSDDDENEANFYHHNHHRRIQGHNDYHVGLKEEDYQDNRHEAMHVNRDISIDGRDLVDGVLEDASSFLP